MHVLILHDTNIDTSKEGKVSSEMNLTNVYILKSYLSKAIHDKSDIMIVTNV